MSRRTGALTAGAALAVASLAAFAQQAPSGHVAPDEPLILQPADRAKVQAVGMHLICYCGCPTQTIADCQCGVADDVKKQIWASLGQGKSLEAIVDAYVAEHGEEFRSMPRGRGLGILAWTVPWAGILAAGAAVMLVVARWSRKGRRAAGAPGTPTAPEASQPEDPYAKRLQEELDQLD